MGEESEPLCPAGYTLPYTTINIITQSKQPIDVSCLRDTPCCEIEQVGVGVGHCRLIPNSPSNANPSCADVKKYALHLVAKDQCIDSTTVYFPDTKKCVQFARNKWALNLTTCGGTEGVNTAIGCVPTGQLDKFLSFLLKWALGASSGIIFLMLILTGYNVLTSGGNPEKLQAAKENVISIFSGLILIVFSLILLKAIGADILELPPFTSTSTSVGGGSSSNSGGGDNNTGGGGGSSGFN